MPYLRNKIVKLLRDNLLQKMCRTKKYKQKSTHVRKINSTDEAENSNIAYFGELMSINELDNTKSGWV